MRILLVRHGQTDWNVEKRAQGHTDIPLNAMGIEQSVRTAKALANEGIKKVLSSDLKRASETARTIAESIGGQLEIDPALREQSFGEWEGAPYPEVGINIGFLADRLGIPRHEVVPERGESHQMVWNRIKPVIQKIQKDTIIVCHGGAMGLILAQLLDGGYPLSRAFSFSNAGVTEVNQRPDGGFRLIRYNDVSHLL
jgi:broad specificity phosphatase PhoE